MKPKDQNIGKILCFSGMKKILVLEDKFSSRSPLSSTILEIKQTLWSFFVHSVMHELNLINLHNPEMELNLYSNLSQDNFQADRKIREINVEHLFSQKR